MKFFKLGLIFIFVTHVTTKKLCNVNERNLCYYKIRNCYKSTLPTSAALNVRTLDECVKFAREKRGLAFNFSPPEAVNYRKGYTTNCQVMACVEIGNTGTLVKDLVYDYYSAYGNWDVIPNLTCIKSVGIFVLSENKQNYTDSIKECQNIGGDLADITTKIRTNHLSGYVNNTIKEWYKAAYVGLDDIEQEGTFMNAFGLMLGCSTYRAWGPGHPISKHKDDDCVILDSDKMWRVVRCGVQLRALCELYPSRPRENPDVKNITCNYLEKNQTKKICTSKEKLFRLYNNASRIDKCALWDETNEQI